MADDDKDWLATALQPDERVAWTGRPEARHYAVAKGLYQSILGVPVILFSLMAWQEGRSDQNLFVSVASFLLLVAGIFMLIGPAWHWFLARYVRYALTDRRALVYRSQPVPSVISYLPERIDRVEVRQHGDGLGSVRFPGEPQSRKLGWAPRPVDGFFGIPDADRVAGLLRDLRGEGA